MGAEDSFDLTAAGLRGDSADLGTSVEVLAGKLEQSLPGRTSVERRGGGLFGRGAKRVRELRVELGSSIFTLTFAEARLDCSRERRVGGIAIKREPLDPADWISQLTEDLRAEGERSAEARAALEQLLG